MEEKRQNGYKTYMKFKKMIVKDESTGLENVYVVDSDGHTLKQIKKSFDDKKNKATTEGDSVFQDEDVVNTLADEPHFGMTQ